MPWISGSSSGGSSGATTQIGRTVLTAAATTVSIAGIPATGSHLVIVVNARYSGGGGAAQCLLQFNGDSGANYDFANAISTGAASVTVTAAAAVTSARIGAVPGSAETAAASGVIQVVVPDYALATYMKQWFGSGFRKDQNAVGNLVTETPGGSWRTSNAPITSVTISLSAAGTYVTGTSLSVYTLT